MLPLVVTGTGDLAELLMLMPASPSPMSMKVFLVQLISGNQIRATVAETEDS